MSDLPPGPSSTILSTYKVGRSPFEFYRECVETYGSPFTLTAMNGTVVCTADPEGARTVFATSADHFIPFGMEAAMPLLEHSIFMLHGDRHKEERKLLVPPFHGARMKHYAEAMREAALEAVDAWVPGERMSILGALQSISMDVILRAIFGVDKNDDFDAYREGVRDLAAAFSPSFLFFRILQREFGGIGPFARFKKAEARFNELIYGVIADKRASQVRGEDVLSLMLEARYDDGSQMIDAQIRDELVTLLIAGHETTSISMAWVLDHLVRAPEILARLREELDAMADPSDAEAISALPYLSAVIWETLRLHPVLSDILRQLAKPMELQGYTLPAGVAVAVLPSLLHTREETFADPFEFKPERFLDTRYPPNEYLPFGGAPRRCIGSAFALYEMKIALATILSRGHFDLVDTEPIETVRRNLVMGPDDGVEMIFRARVG